MPFAGERPDSDVPPQQPLAVLVAWIDALRRGDLEAIEGLLDPEVVWRGVPADAICHDRRDVLDMRREQLAAGLVRVSAAELVAGDEAVVLGVRSDELREIGGVDLAGQVFNVFRLAEGRIVAIQDHATRQAALVDAAAEPPRWT
jgi:ketosteroid isomerase-like protein